MEGDSTEEISSPTVAYFNPLPPHGGRLQHSQRHTSHHIISIHSLRMEGDISISSFCTVCLISIHSLRMEGDVNNRLFFILGGYFNPLPPHGGRRLNRRLSLFSRRNFNPLPPHGGRPELIIAKTLGYVISIHSLRMEGDSKRFPVKCSPSVFQSTPSAWRETVVKSSWLSRISYFNPLPPHGGRRQPVLHGIGRSRYFNPLPPHGGRRMQTVPPWMLSGFQSTPSAWRETCSPGVVSHDLVISIHSLRMEGDPPKHHRMSVYFLFQSTPSAWRETLLRLGNLSNWKNFNPLPPHGGRRMARPRW